MKFNIVNQENDVNVAQRGDASSMDCTARQGAPDRHHATAKMEKQKKKKNVFKIATWNVRTLLQHGKLENVKKEMVRLKLISSEYQKCVEKEVDVFKPTTTLSFSPAQKTEARWELD